MGWKEGKRLYITEPLLLQQCSLFLSPTSPWGPSPPTLPHPVPFVIQGSIGCELHPNGTSRGFYTAALEGEDFVSFDRDTQEWVAWREDELTWYVRDSLNRNKGTVDMLHFFLNTTCIKDLGSFLRYGKEALERQGEARPMRSLSLGVSYPTQSCNCLWGGAW